MAKPPVTRSGAAPAPPKESVERAKPPKNGAAPAKPVRTNAKPKPSPSPRARRPRPRGPALRAHAALVLDRLLERYPDAHCALDFTNAYQLLCATILSAQCTDKRVNLVTPALFARYPDARSLAAARQEDVEELIRTTGFFRNKAKSLIGMATAVVEHHGGDIPGDMDSLVVLPGVGRKTANVILGNAFGRNDGIVVDTHVTRLSNRLARNAGFVHLGPPPPSRVPQVLAYGFPAQCTDPAPVYIFEIAPAERRGALTGLFQFNIVFGILLTFVSNGAMQ